MTLTTERPATTPVLDVPALRTRLLGRWPEARSTARTFAADPRLDNPGGLPMAEHRARVLENMRILAAEGSVRRGFPVALGGQDCPGAGLAAFEELLAADPSLAIKSGVQWGLFASAILHLGNAEQQAAWLPGALDLSIPGIFAMTETGHGSDVASIATTAVYDPATDEFVVHTPFEAARKDYLGNAALHGVAAVVFAHLITRGVDHGVHALYVPVRDAAGEFLPGITGSDDGLKGGLNGIDNGRLAFDRVRVPRTNLLDRFGAVDSGGVYTSDIPSPGRRFFTMISTLVQGRVSLDGAANVAAKLGLITAITYGNQRRQFPGPGGTETVLLDYAEHRRRLLPRLAAAYAAHFAHEELLDTFHTVFSDTEATDTDRQELETLAASLKPRSTWDALDTLQTCREACGGAGFLWENRIVGLRADMDVFVTFEGDNTVLLQLVGKRLLADYAAAFAHMDAPTAARYVAGRASDLARRHTPVVRMAQAVADTGSARRSAGSLRDPEVQFDLLADRLAAMVSELAAALRPAEGARPARAAELFDAHQHELIAAARAHGDLVRWRAFTLALDTMPDEGTARVMTRVRNLYAMSVLEENLAWYLMHGRISAHRARTVAPYIERLCAKLRPHAQDLVDAFGYGPGSVKAVIAGQDEARRQAEAIAWARAERASSEAPVPEKQLRAARR